MAEGREEEPAVVVLGIGNLLWADEGFGVRAVELLHRLYAFSGNVRLVDGGTQGLYLLQHVRDADILVIFDAVDYGLAPGAMKLVEGEAVPAFMGVKKMSLHQTGFQEVLASAAMLGELPQELLLVGVQPAELEDYGGGLTPRVRAQLRPAVEDAVAWLAARGVPARLRPQPLPEDATIGCSVMTPERYEGGRPRVGALARHGDARLLLDPHWRPPRDMDEEIEAVLAQVPRMDGGEG